MVAKSTTLLITTHRDDYVQGNIGEGLEGLLEHKVDVAEFHEIEFLIDKDIDILWRGESILGYNNIIMYGGISRLLRLTHPLAIALRALHENVYTSGAENFRGVDKLTQGVFFALNNIPVPRTYFASPQNICKNAENMIGFPLVLKDILSSQGERNFLITNQKELVNRMQDMESDRYIAQEFIENEGDMRVLINAGGKYVAFRKRAVDGSHLNNTSAGAEATLLAAVPDDLLGLCRRVVVAMNMPLLGIDVIERDGQYYFLEANTQPLIFTGAFPDKKQAVLLDSLRSAGR